MTGLSWGSPARFDDGGERHRRADPPQGHAGDPADRGRVRDLDDGTGSGGAGAPAPFARRCACDRGDERATGRGGLARHTGLHIGEPIAMRRVRGGAMSPENMSKLREAVELYCQRHSISPAFEPSPLYDLQRDWHDKEFPNSRGPGCYIFYAENGDVLYIGKASFRHSLGSRIVSYFRGGKPKDNWSRGGPRYLQTVPVAEAWQAPSLEEFLTARSLRWTTR